MRAEADVSYSEARRLLSRLYRLSESRGSESCGIHFYLPREREAWTIKGEQSPSVFLRSPEYAHIAKGPLRSSFSDDGGRAARPVLVLAHSRLVTNGTAALPSNNQPVRWGPVTMIHNGIVVNVERLWQENPHLVRTAEVDTEVLAALASDSIGRNADPIASTRRAFARLCGAASVAWVHDQTAELVLATNTGDLYYCDWLEHGLLVFASERYILERAIRAVRALRGSRATWLGPGSGLAIRECGKGESFSIHSSDFKSGHANHLLPPARHTDVTSGPVRSPTALVLKCDESLLRYDEKRIGSLRRCSRCVLPETFPFITFGESGVCSYCRHYRPRYGAMDPTESRRAFIRSLEQYRRDEGEPDALVAFSGGRDSSFGLHLIKREFGLNPVTFTYDWGMVTDLARRNIARLCGQLGVQNILVSANIAAKRDNIRRNVAAWLRKPDLGLVPLFMAGDKHFFRLVNQLKRRTGIRLDLWCANPLENTDFKSGLCGVSPDFDKQRVDYLSLGRKIQLAAYYGFRFLQNPALLNRSIPDTLSAFAAYYVEPRRDFFFIFDHFVWNEAEVNATLRGEYDWELSSDSSSTWRIGDGTAPFYNYIYVTALGFSEFDTLRSNQVREGMITREQALAAVVAENRPRAAGLRWYLETIGLEFDTVIARINGLDTMHLHS
jgi:glucosamine--fructose-6-phosphate aminotransferase (isomerizing)